MGPAKHILFTGLPYEAERAERFGLVTGVYQPAELAPAALDLAARIASRAPLSVEATKRVVSSAPDLAPAEALALQANELRALIQTADHLAAVTAFLEKRRPIFTRS